MYDLNVDIQIFDSNALHTPANSNWILLHNINRQTCLQMGGKKANDGLLIRER